LTVAHCPLSNPFHLQQPILLDVHEGHGYTKEYYAILFIDMWKKWRSQALPFIQFLWTTSLPRRLGSISFIHESLCTAGSLIFNVSPHSDSGSLATAGGNDPVGHFRTDGHLRKRAFRVIVEKSHSALTRWSPASDPWLSNMTR
jgi:hypothetical protein